MARTYRHRVALQEPVPTQDSTTGEVFVFWSTVADCSSIPCEVLTGPGREFKASGTTQAETSLRVAFRWFDGLLPTWRLVYNGKTYNSGSIETDATGRREYRLTCTGLGEALPALPTPVSAVIAANGTTLTWTFSAPLGGSGTLGWALSGATIASGTVAGLTVTQTISQVLAGATVTGGYSATTGNLAGYGGDVATFSSFAITNNSQVGAGYKLDDDGTNAALFGVALLPTASPARRRAAYTLTATNQILVAMPASIVAAPGLAPLADGVPRVCGFKIRSVPAAGSIGDIIFQVYNYGGAGSVLVNANVTKDDGATTGTIQGQAGTYPPSVASFGSAFTGQLVGAKVAVEMLLAAGNLSAKLWVNGALLGASASIATDGGVFADLYVQDGAGAGGLVDIEAIPGAQDGLDATYGTFSAGAVGMDDEPL